MSQFALILDFGGPVLLTPFELVADQPGSPAHQLLAGKGPMATPTSPDPQWESLQAGQITERDYWDDRARHWHAAGGTEPDIRELIDHLYQPARPELIRPQTRQLIADAKTAGMPVAVLTNDLNDFHSQEWIDGIAVLNEFALVVDGSIEGVLKPDPRLYDILAERLGVPFSQMVFLDDQMTNIRGARASGIDSVWLDVADPSLAIGHVRKRLDLPE